jgi:hypothetical protein
LTTTKATARPQYGAGRGPTSYILPWWKPTPVMGLNKFSKHSRPLRGPISQSGTMSGSISMPQNFK